MNAEQRGAAGEGRTGIDWDEVRGRVEAARRAVEGDATPTPEAARALLRARAQALAREPAEPPGAGERLDVLEFLLAHERYAVETGYVREVHALRELTPVPGAPPCVLGLVSVRGRILAVVDLKRLFDLPARGLTELDRLILLHSDGVEFGILADAILGLRRLPLTELEPGLPTLTGIRQDYLRGITRERAVVLDAAKLLAGEGLVVWRGPERRVPPIDSTSTLEGGP